MVQTTADLFSVDGVVLNTLAKNIESITGRLMTPTRRGTNTQLPGRNGEVSSEKTFGPGFISLPMWVAGCDDDGEIPSGSTARKAFFANVAELSRLFIGRNDLLDVRQIGPDGTTRQCWAEVLDAINFAHSSFSDPYGKFAVNLTVPDSFWRDTEDQTQFFANPGATLDATSFSAATAPMDDLTYEILGPCNNPKISASNGSYFQYNDVIAAGDTLVVDSGTWELSSTDFTPDHSKVEHGATARWLVLGVGSPPVLNWSATGGQTSSTRLTVTGRRKYLVAI